MADSERFRHPLLSLYNQKTNYLQRITQKFQSAVKKMTNEILLDFPLDVQSEYKGRMEQICCDYGMRLTEHEVRYQAEFESYLKSNSSAAPISGSNAVSNSHHRQQATLAPSHRARLLRAEQEDAEFSESSDSDAIISQPYVPVAHSRQKPVISTSSNTAFKREESCTSNDIHNGHTSQVKHCCGYDGCDSSFVRKADLCHHIRESHGGKPYECEHADCHQTFAKHRELTWHVQTAHSFKCRYCNQVFPLKQSLAGHTAKCRRERQQYTTDTASTSTATSATCKECPVCHKTFSSGSALGGHMNCHSKMKRSAFSVSARSAPIFSCKLCKKTFSSKNALYGHMSFHAKQKQTNTALQSGSVSISYACKVCPQTFSCAQALAGHMNRHSNQKLTNSSSTPPRIAFNGGVHGSFDCPICGKSFSSMQALGGHTSSAHTKPRLKRKREQEMAEQGSLRSPANKKQHVMMSDDYDEEDDSDAELAPEQEEQDEGSFTCNICGKSLLTVKGFNAHRMLHENVRPWKCPHCGLGFTLKDHWSCHIQKVHQQEQAKPHKCYECDQVFREFAQLREHKKRQHGGLKASNKPYPCDECKLVVYDEQHLNRHKAWCHGVEQYDGYQEEEEAEAELVNSNNAQRDEQEEEEEEVEEDAIVEVPEYKRFNALEQEEIAFGRALCQNLLHEMPSLYSLERLSAELNLDSDLFVNWVYHKDQQPQIFNDVHVMVTVRNPQQYLLLADLRRMRQKIKQELKVKKLSRSPGNEQILYPKIEKVLADILKLESTMRSPSLFGAARDDAQERNGENHNQHNHGQSADAEQEIEEKEKEKEKQKQKEQEEDVDIEDKTVVSSANGENSVECKVCRKHVEHASVIKCGDCQQWYHHQCVKLTMQAAQELVSYSCAQCTQSKSAKQQDAINPPSSTMSRSPTSSRNRRHRSFFRSSRAQ